MPARKAVTPPTDLASKRPADVVGRDDDDPVDALTALRAEAAAPDEEGHDGSVAVPLLDTAVRVKHPNDWPSSANEDLQFGRYYTWARKVLAGDDFDIWADLDPTNAQAGEFLDNWQKAVGMSLGGTSASRRSLNGTRGR